MKKTIFLLLFVLMLLPVLAACGSSAEEDPLCQISFSDMRADEIRDTLRKTDLNTLTPLEALNLLYSLQRKALE